LQVTLRKSWLVHDSVLRHNQTTADADALSRWIAGEPTILQEIPPTNGSPDPIRFQAGLSIAEFMQPYGSNERCEAVVVESRRAAGSRH
jgi:hypothetical protein